MATIRHVVPADDGRWQVVEELDKESETPTFERRRDAEAHAKDLVRKAGGGDVVLHARSGSITEVDTVGTPDPPAVAV